MEGAEPPIWKERENYGAKQPLPGVHKCARIPMRDRKRETSCFQRSGLSRVGESWLVAHLGRQGFLGAQVSDL